MPLLGAVYASSHPLRSITTATRDPRVFARPGQMSPAENEAYQLFILAEAGVEKLRLRASRAPDSAPECHETDGFEMTVDEAMALRPIPHEVGPGWRCGCTYRPAG